MLSKQELINKNKNANRHFFSSATMKGFNSKLESNGYTIKTFDGNCYLFVYSNANYNDTGRDYKIALMLPNGQVAVNKLYWHDSVKMAKNYLEQLTEFNYIYPLWLLEFCWDVIAKFHICGVCDLTYIANVTANELKTGNGQSLFFSSDPDLTNFENAVNKLNFAYSTCIARNKQFTVENLLKVNLP